MLSDITEVVGLFVQMASKVICFMLQPDIYGYPVSEDYELSGQRVHDTPLL